MTSNGYQLDDITPRWLDWAREIQAIAQTGMHFSDNIFQRQRYQRLFEIAAEIIAEHSNLAQTDTLPSI